MTLIWPTCAPLNCIQLPVICAWAIRTIVQWKLSGQLLYRLLWVHVSERCNARDFPSPFSQSYDFHYYCGEGQFPRCVNEWMSGGDFPFNTCGYTCISLLWLHFWNSEQICDSACTKWEVIWLSLIHNSVWSVTVNCCLLIWIWFVIL